MSKDNPDEDLNFEIGERVAGYTIVEKIDEGGFGQVFKVTKDEKTFAMKIENNAMDGGSAIKLEISVFKGLIKESVFPRFLSGGKRQKYHYLVLELLGDNLRMLKARTAYGASFSEGTWSRVGIQCLFALKTMHDNGFVHRDVKPNNFAIGLGNRCRFILAFDFGLARKFVKSKADDKKSGKEEEKKGEKKEEKKTTLKAVKSCAPIPSREASGASKETIMPRKTGSTNTLLVEITAKAEKTDKPTDKEKTLEESCPAKSEKMAFRVARPHTDFRGTHQYASPNAHMLKELGRVDDVWSLMYMVAELFVELPWSTDDLTPIEEQKERATLRNIFDKNKALDAAQLRHLDEMETMLRECTYYSHPNYELVYQFLLGVFKKSGVVWSSRFDWETPQEAATAVKLSEGSPMRWCKPGDFFKIDKWAQLRVPGARSTLHRSSYQSHKPPSKKGSKKTVTTGSKLAKKQLPSRQAVKASREDSIVVVTPVAKSVMIQPVKKNGSMKKSREKP